MAYIGLLVKVISLYYDNIINLNTKPQKTILTSEQFHVEKPFYAYIFNIVILILCYGKWS